MSKEIQLLDRPKVSDSVMVKGNYLLNQIRNSFLKNKLELTDYQKQVGMNAIMEMEKIAQKSGKSVMQFPPDNVYDVLQTIVNNELDVVNGEIVILTSKERTADSTYASPEWREIFSLRSTTKGHTELLRKRATGINKEQPFNAQWVVYEGDEWRGVRYEGTQAIEPTYEPKYKSNKVLFVVYALNMKDGTNQWVIANREKVKPSIIAQMVNNGVPFEETQKIWDLSVDEILDKYSDLTFKKNGKNGKYDTPYLNLTWRSKQNRESMVETKLRGVIAARMVDITHNNHFQKQAFERIVIEEKYDFDEYEDQRKQVILDSGELIENEENTIDVEPENINKDYVDKRAKIEPEWENDKIDNTEKDSEVKENVVSDYLNEDKVVETEIKTEQKQEEKEEKETEDDDLFAQFNL